MSDREVDQQLVARAQAGDQSAFELLVIKYQRRLVRLLSRMLKNTEEAEDVAQEAFIKAYRALPSFRGESAFYTWLYRIATNAAKNHIAANAKHAVNIDDWQSDEGEPLEAAASIRDPNTPENHMMSQQLAQTVENALTLLPEDLRTAVMMREMEGLSYEEIAQKMDCPIGTVRSRIFRAREAIAKELRPLLDTHPSQRW